MKYTIEAVSRIDDFFAIAPWEIRPGRERFSDLNSLIRQISERSKPVTLASIETYFKSGGTLILAIAEDRIIGVVCLVKVSKIGGFHGTIEDVGVDVDYRGHGVAKAMMGKAIEIARVSQLGYLNLTTRPKREAANKLYIGLGFIKRETNPYRLIL